MRLTGPLRVLLAMVLVSYATLSFAHKPSDSYLTVTQAPSGNSIEGQWDIALRDLDHAIGVDINGDGVITWGELKARRAAIERYAFGRLAIEVGAGGEAAATHDATGSRQASAGASHAGVAQNLCPTRVTELLTDTHVDGTYAVFRFTGQCPTRATSLTIRYSLLFDLDPNHRGLLDVRAGAINQASVLSRESPIATISVSSPGRLQQLGSFLTEGIWHIWEGYDHILFLLTLLFPAVVLASLRAAIIDVAKVVTAFTVAHSLTLSLAVNGFIHLPSRLVETAIAVTVLLGALNNLFPVVRKRRWLVAFVFGLIHGLGFASVLGDLGLQGTSLALALVGFNLGVEAGQLAIVLVFIPLGYLCGRTLFYRRVFLPGSAAVIGCIALYWIVARSTGTNFL